MIFHPDVYEYRKDVYSFPEASDKVKKAMKHKPTLRIAIKETKITFD